MGFRRKRRGRRQAVRWLVDNSSFAQLTRIPLSTPAAAGGTQFPLLPDLPKAGSLAQMGQIAGFDLSNFARTQDDSLILDHIGGKVFWDLNNNSGGEGAQDADGTWAYIIRSAIVISPRAKKVEGAGAGDVADLGPAGFDLATASNLLDPSSDYDIMQQGSNLPDGVRILWRRNWVTIVDWSYGSSVAGSCLDSESSCPPGPYVDIKPMRLLRPNDVLQCMFRVDSYPWIGSPTGTSSLTVGCDLRVAAHNTRRRR